MLYFDLPSANDFDELASQIFIAGHDCRACGLAQLFV